MERHDKLYENYEDALFALLMDKIAEEEGARLLEENERLMNDPDAEVPESFDNASREAIRRAASGKRRRATTRRFGRMLSKLAVAVLVALLLFGSAYAAFPLVRVKTLNLLIQSSNVASRLAVVKDEEDSGTPFTGADTLMGYQLPALSKDYIVVDKKENERNGWIECEDGTGGVIRIGIEKSYAVYLDTEDIKESKPVTIHGFSGTLAEKGDTITVSWHDTENNNLIVLTCINTDRVRAISYANEIVYIE